MIFSKTRGKVIVMLFFRYCKQQ